MRRLRLFLTVACVLGLSACQRAQEAPAQPAPPRPVVSTLPEGQAIDRAEFVPAGGPTDPATMTAKEKSLAVNGQAPADPSQLAGRRRLLIKAQVLLDRAGFDPGVIDGRAGAGFKQALSAFEQSNGLPADGELDARAWRALTRDDGPVMQDYEIPPGASAETLAARFRMDPGLLEELNPGIDFTKAGTTVLVAAAVPAS